MQDSSGSQPNKKYDPNLPYDDDSDGNTTPSTKRYFKKQNQSNQSQGRDNDNNDNDDGIYNEEGYEKGNFKTHNQNKTKNENKNKNKNESSYPNIHKSQPSHHISQNQQKNETNSQNKQETGGSSNSGSNSNFMSNVKSTTTQTQSLVSPITPKNNKMNINNSSVLFNFAKTQSENEIVAMMEQDRSDNKWLEFDPAHNLSLRELYVRLKISWFIFGLLVLLSLAGFIVQIVQSV